MPTRPNRLDSDALTVSRHPARPGSGPLLVDGDSRLFYVEEWLSKALDDLPGGTEVRLVVQVLSEPGLDGWHDTATRLPDAGVFVRIRLADGSQEVGRIVDKIWHGDQDRVVFASVTHWRETT